MKFYVPSRGRPSCQTPHTLHRFGVQKQDIIVVVRPDEQNKYADIGFELHVLPKKVQGLSQTRQHLIEQFTKIHCQIDDDITGFLFKPDTSQWAVVPITKVSAFRKMIDIFEQWLDTGITACSTQDRVGLAHPSNSSFKDYARIGQMIFLNPKTIIRRGYRFDRVKLYADQDMALQIVRGGDVTRVSCTYGHTMKPTYAPGGCQAYRNQKCIDESANKLVKLHPGLVRLRWKRKGKFNVPSRIIAWKKARQGE